MVENLEEEYDDMREELDIRISSEIQNIEEELLAGLDGENYDFLN